MLLLCFKKVTNRVKGLGKRASPEFRTAKAGEGTWGLSVCLRVRFKFSSKTFQGGEAAAAPWHSVDQPGNHSPGECDHCLRCTHSHEPGV